MLYYLKFWKYIVIAALLSGNAAQHLSIKHKNNQLEKIKIELTEANKQVKSCEVKLTSSFNSIALQNKEIEAMAKTVKAADKKVKKFQKLVDKSSKKYKKRVQNLLNDAKIKNCEDGIEWLINKSEDELKW